MPRPEQAFIMPPPKPVPQREAASAAPTPDYQAQRVARLGHQSQLGQALDTARRMAHLATRPFRRVRPGEDLAAVESSLQDERQTRALAEQIWQQLNQRAHISLLDHRGFTPVDILRRRIAVLPDIAYALPDGTNPNLLRVQRALDILIRNGRLVKETVTIGQDKDHSTEERYFSPAGLAARKRYQEQARALQTAGDAAAEATRINENLRKLSAVPDVGTRMALYMLAYLAIQRGPVSGGDLVRAMASWSEPQAKDINYLRPIMKDWLLAPRTRSSQQEPLVTFSATDSHYRLTAAGLAILKRYGWQE